MKKIIGIITACILFTTISNAQNRIEIPFAKQIKATAKDSISLFNENAKKQLLEIESNRMKQQRDTPVRYFLSVSEADNEKIARWMAIRSQQNLYKINLSQVISKYIGETEKNITKIFAAAEKGDMILLFDEADALFGKRTSVKDAHDKYANQEVSYFMQQAEKFKGTILLQCKKQNCLSQSIRKTFVAIEDKQ